MASSAEALAEGAVAPLAELISGITVEVRDLAVARHVFEVMLGDVGRWSEASHSVVVETDAQRIELVRRARPRGLGDRGYHLALRVSRSRLPAITDELASSGCAINRWREDHAAEREPAPYVADANGNLVQLVPTDTVGPIMLDHITMPFDDVEAADNFYRLALGGALDHYFGWRMVDVHGARRSDEHAAPWTRLTRFSRVQQNTQTNPIPQLFLSFGSTRLGLFVSTKHLQEPPEGVIKGTPCIVFRTSTPADQVEAHLSEVDVTTASTALRVKGVPYERSGGRFFLRDPSGNFVVLECPA